MNIDATAAVLREHGGALTLEPVRVEAPRDGEVLVEIEACGVCHTDMVMRDGHLPVPTPVVLGHEGAGIVQAIGAGVTHVATGDRVVLSFASCGGCAPCCDHIPAYCEEFFPRNFFAQRADGSTSLTGQKAGEVVHSHVFGQSAFATHAVAPARNVVRVPDELDVSLAQLAPIGCGIQTGAGTVYNSLRVQAGSRLAVIGTGAVGMAAIMAARHAGAKAIVAIDLSRARLDLAANLGATHAVLSDGRPIPELLADIALPSVDYIIDTTGVPEVVNQAVGALANRGVLALVAAYPPDFTIAADLQFMMSGGRSVIGVVEGSSDPQTFIPKLLALHKNGLLPFERLIKYYAFDALNEAIEAGESGAVIKPVVTMR